jgi:thioredoxin 1
MVLSVSNSTFEQEVLASPIPVLVDFGAPWCGLCQLIQPLLLQFYDRYNSRIKLVKVNADENFKLSTTYRLTNLPTLLLIENGKVRDRLENFHSPKELQAILEEISTSYAVMSNGSLTIGAWQHRRSA